jgi:hypothetical protein
MFGISALAQSPFASLGGAVLFGDASVTASATVTVSAFRIRFTSGAVSGTATVSANAIRIQNAAAAKNGFERMLQ